MFAFLPSWSGSGPLTIAVDGCDGQVGVVDCTAMDAQIATCQRAGKRILLSLGGALGVYGLTDDSAGVALAGRLWRLFLGGQPGPGEGRRPWATRLDGIDLDIEAGTSAGYAAMVSALRRQMDADRSQVRWAAQDALTAQPYFITAAPQCPQPDALLGPGPGTALGEAASSFDALFVQFCAWTASGAS